MAAGWIQSMGALWPGRLTGPIFAKELRVSSRRRRNYALRFAYLLVLTAFLAAAWQPIVQSAGAIATAWSVSQMPQIGLMVVVCIAWFQFCAAQLLAVILLSTAISDEIYHKTLGVLMTTPITSFQIVMGKLLGKLLQILLLLAISLPMLAIVRVFGGVAWDYVVSSLCITLTATIFAGAVSMHYSIRSRRAYAVILATLLTGVVLYALLPWLAYAYIFEHRALDRDWMQLFVHLNPFAAMVFNTQLSLFPSSMPVWFSWPLHCLAMLGASALVLVWCTARVRKTALRQATGEAGTFRSRRRARAAARTPAAAAAAADPPARGTIRRVRGSPIVWKELRTPMLRGGRISAIIGAVTAVVVLLLTYAALATRDSLDQGGIQMAYVLVFVLVGMSSTTILSATSITSEKETRSWPALLATPVSDWHLLAGKLVGVLRRCLPIWLLLFAHLVLFVAVGYIHRVALLHVTMIWVSVLIFLTCAGLYFSAACRRTTPAVILNLGLALTIWLILPGVLGVWGDRTDMPRAVSGAIVSLNPAYQTGAVMEAAGGRRNAEREVVRLDYDWPGRVAATAAETTRRLFHYLLLYAAAGLLFACRAKANLRRNVF